MTEEFHCTTCGHHVTRSFPSAESRARTLAAFGEVHMVTCGVCWDGMDLNPDPDDVRHGGEL